MTIALAGVGSRWVDKLHARELYEPDETITAPLQVAFGTPIQVLLSGPSVTKAGELRFSAVAARTPTAKCKSTPVGCAQTTSLTWMSEVMWEQPHTVLGHLGLRAGRTPAPLVLGIDIQEQRTTLLVTTELKNSETLIARSVRHLPKEHPPASPAIVLWFWHVLEDNLLAWLIGPGLERIPHDIFKDFLARALIVVPEAPLPSVTAEILDRASFEPPLELKVEIVEGRRAGHCPVRVIEEGGYGHTMIHVWDQRHPIVAAIPTRGLSRCLPDGIYTYRQSASDTYTIERYDFDGAVRWRRSVRFPSRFDHDVTIPPSSLADIDGRGFAVLNVFDYQYVQEGQFRVKQEQVLLHERIAFSFPTSDETSHETSSN